MNVTTYLFLFDREEITKAIVKEIMNVGKNFNKALIFAIDIDHAEHIAEVLLQSGETAYVVHSKMGDKNRDNVVKMFKDGRIRYLVNVNILTTGFDAPDIDLICLLRPTKSPVLHVQSIGRGLRVHPSKTYTMVLDFAGNTERLGPINNITIRKKRESKEKQDPVRLFQGQLHMSKTGIGMKMANVRLPQLVLEANRPNRGLNLDNQQVNPSSILKYLGISGIGDFSATSNRREFNALSYLSYWSIYKQYYANKREEEGCVIHNDTQIIYLLS